MRGGGQEEGQGWEDEGGVVKDGIKELGLRFR